ncbi:MAG: hypothetical protein IJM63_02500 [Solobacterium sp.]|nr:hypothetical protein [Solobacterium sp.]MBQ9823340.1 hypothetical protein [Solobacterium sp.]
MDADLTVFAVWETATEPMFKSHQLILSGQIGMHFLMILPEGTENGRMVFTVGSSMAEAE